MDSLIIITGLHDTAYSYNYFGGDSVLKALLVYKFEMTLNVTYWNRQEVWKFRPRNCKDSWSLDELLFCQGRSRHFTDNVTFSLVQSMKILLLIDAKYVTI